MSEHPAGWYPDPRGRHEYRYWDGSVWTDHVADQGVSGTDPVNVVGPAKTEEPEPAAAETVERAPEPTIPAEQEPDNTPAPAESAPAAEASTGSGLWSSEEPASSARNTPAGNAISSDPGTSATPVEPATHDAPTSAGEPAGSSPDPGTATSAAAAASAGAAASEPGGASTGPAASEPAGSSVDPAADPAAVSLSKPSSASPGPDPAPGGAAGGPPPPSATAHSGPNAGDQAKAALKSATATKSPALAGLLTVAFPGSGHFYLGAGDKAPLAIGLLALTVAAYVVSWFSFTSFVIGFVIWAAAAAYGVFDLQGVLKPIREAGAAAASISPQQVGLVLVAGGALLVVGLLLPWYHVSVDFSGPASAFGGGGYSGSVNGFKALDVIDIVLLVIGLGSIGLGATAMGLGPLTGQQLPPWLPTATAGIGVGALVLVAFRMLSVGAGAPDADGIDVAIGRGPGILLAGAAALAIAAAGLVTLIQAPRANNASRSEDTTAA